MFGSIRKFATNRKGAFAMQFALMAVPLCVCTGLAIDGGRAFLARFELASALDAAALAVGSTTTEGADLNAVAQKYVDINFKTEHDEPIELQLDITEERAILRGTVEINTYFMPLVGQPTVTVSAESEVRVGGNNVEVAMALDITGSMNATRIAGLKDAAKILVDEVIGTVQTPYFSKAAIVPWSQSVYVGTTHANASAPVDLRGTPTPSTPITAATWRKSGGSTKSISTAGWRTNTGKSLSGAAWKNGGAKSISEITKTNSNTRIRVTTSSSHGYSNGDAVYITSANGSYTSLNGQKYLVADKTSTRFWLKDVASGAYVAPPSGSTNASSGTGQRCLTARCEIRITANSHGFATGDLIYISGANESGGGASINNTWGTTWTITTVDSNKFDLDNTDGPSFKSYSSNGKASECYVSDCRYRVTTSSAHGLSAADDVFIWGITEANSSQTSVNTSANSTIQVSSPSGSTFYLPGDGEDYNDWSSGGSVAACANSDCNVEVTSNSHGIADGDRVEITGVGGLTGINGVSGQRTWATTKINDNAFRLDDSTPALSNMSSNYTSGGTAQCLAYGCAKLSVSSSSSSTPYQATPCMVERYGANAATDVSPATTPLGILYSSSGTCTTTNYVTPLTADRTRLNTSIDDLKTGGSTAGQIGIAWAWYMLSPNFADVWDKEAANQPKDYATKELVKVAVLMTDGEFNYTTCDGLQEGSGISGCSVDTPFVQAQAICTAMKDQKITIYTVGLQINTALEADDFLIACATKPSYAFLAADEAELKVAFKKIATSISKLRISK